MWSIFKAFATPQLIFLRHLDVFAFASISEGFGIVLLEAMAVGLPIVGSNIYPINHIVIDDETGILVSPTKPDEFAVTNMRLINDQTMKDRMGAAGMKRCRNEFTEDKMLAETEQLYTDLLILSNEERA